MSQDLQFSMISEVSAAMMQFVKDQIMNGASDSELMAFVQVAKATGLDPMRRQIYAVARWDKNEQRNKWIWQASIEGFRSVADGSGSYEGQVGPFWCGPDGQWRDVWLSSTPPAAAKVGVLRKGWREPLYRIALYSEYVQRTKEGKITKFWLEKPTLMLAKCAEAQAIRAAFPQRLSNVYSEEEIPKEVEVKAEVAPLSPQAPKETPKSTALPPEVGAQGQQEVSSGLKAIIDRAAKGGPEAAKPKQESQELVPLKWDGQLPTCFDGLMPLGKHQGVPMTKAPIEDVKAMAKWIEDKAKKDGGVHPSLRLAYFQAQDLFENTIEPAPQEMFNPNGSSRI